MLYTFFVTQLYNPTHGDWTEQVKVDCADFRIPFNLEYMQGKSTESFKKLVKIKAEEYSLDKFCEKKEKHSKMSNLQYTELKTKEYLNTPGITTEEVLKMFKWRVRMAPLGENFRSNQPLVVCPLCQNHLDNQLMTPKCV